MTYTETKEKFCRENPNSFMLINEISKLFHDHMREEAARNGMQDAYRELLRPLAQEDGKTQLELVKITHLKAPTISVTLQRMEQDGIVVRKTDPEDMRQIRVYLTEAGRQLHIRMHESIRKTEDLLLTDVSEEEERQMRAVLKKVRDNALHHWGGVATHGEKENGKK